MKHPRARVRAEPVTRDLSPPPRMLDFHTASGAAHPAVAVFTVAGGEQDKEVALFPIGGWRGSVLGRSSFTCEGRRHGSRTLHLPPPTRENATRHVPRGEARRPEARGPRLEAELPCAVRGVARGWRGVVEGGAWRVARGTGSGRGVE